jgi:hypothetical protein
MVEELCFAIKADPLQIRREGDNANIIFEREGFGCLGVAIEHDLCKNIRDIDR